jgi:hypothetical protein
MIRMGTLRHRATFLGVIVVVVQTSAWWLFGQHRLVQLVPEMAERDFSFYEAHERKYQLPINSPMRLVVCDDLRHHLGVEAVTRLSTALKRFHVTVTEAARGDRSAPQLCFGTGWQSPVVAKAETWVGPQSAGLGGNGFDHYYLHVLGAWIPLWNRMAWVS